MNMFSAEVRAVVFILNGRLLDFIFIILFLCANLTGLQWAGLIWITVMSRTWLYLYQNLAWSSDSWSYTIKLKLKYFEFFLLTHNVRKVYISNKKQ